MGKSEKNTSFSKELNTSLENKYKNRDYLSQNESLINKRYEEENENIVKIITNLPKINAPFGSSSIKSSFQQTPSSIDPGPGSYEPEIDINKIISNCDNSNKFFITGDTRFKSSDNQVPGVGEYNIRNSSLNYNNNLTPKRKRRQNGNFNRPLY